MKNIYIHENIYNIISIYIHEKDAGKIFITKSIVDRIKRANIYINIVFLEDSKISLSIIMQQRTLDLTDQSFHLLV